MGKKHLKQSISAIIPVFNEEKTVRGVIEVLLKNPLIDEIICVNDGSTDQSLKILNKFKDRVQIINLKKNRGKGYALAEGIKKAKGEIVIFIDADLINLSDNHIDTLLEPILSGKSSAVLGYSESGLVPNVFSNLTGQRAYYKNDLVSHLEKIAETRFGVEVFLNNLFTSKETKKVPLKNLRGLYKYEKRKSTNAIKEYFAEAAEIAQEIGKKEILSPKDYRIITQLDRVTTFKEYKDKVQNISNSQVKQLLEQYLLKYIKITQEKLKDL